jgi:hypothetical protein
MLQGAALAVIKTHGTVIVEPTKPWALTMSRFSISSILQIISEHADELQATVADYS